MLKIANLNNKLTLKNQKQERGVKIIFYAEPKTKDGIAGAIIMAEQVEAIVEECAKWVRDEKLKMKDLISLCPVVNRESQMILGDILFTGTAPEFKGRY